MKRSRLIIPLVALATMALMLSATGVSAAPHTTFGDSTTTCDVDGFVELDGLDNNASNNHYRFEQTQLKCDGKKGDTYDVEAEGDTTDYFHQGVGEDCARGGSAVEDQDDDPKVEEHDVHSGWIEAVGQKKSMIGEVHFVRQADIVLADGPLWNGFNDHDDLPTAKQNPPDQWFQAKLVFQPIEGDCLDKENPVTRASLTGDAEIFNAEDVVAHDCGVEELAGKDDKHGHCFPL